MSKQADVLPMLLARCAEAHPDCGVRLQGSVARGTERTDSDIDLTVVVPGNALVLQNDLLSNDNHWAMRRIYDEVTGAPLDINWVGADELLEVIARRGAAAWFMFLTGTTLRDPIGAAARCERAVADWFDAHPKVLSAWRQQQAAVEAFKSNPGSPLDFATQPAFLQHLADLELSGRST